MPTNDPSLYWFGGTGDWADEADWQTSAGAPAEATPTAGDTIYITGGDINIPAADDTDFGTLDDETIYLGAPPGSAPPIFDTTDVTLGTGTAIELTGSYLDATWTARGTTQLNGTVDVTAANSSLRLGAITDTNANPGVITVGVDGLVAVGSEGYLNFANGTLDVYGSLIVSGRAIFQQGTDLVGQTNDTIEVTQNGSLTIDGTAAGWITFEGANASLELGDPAFFDAHIADIGTGDTIDLSGIVATGASYNAQKQQLTLTNAGGTVVDQLLISGQGSDSWASNVFNVTNNGSSSQVTLAGPIIVADVLPVAIFASPGEQVSLATILTDAFGSTANFGTVYVSYMDAATLAENEFVYWTGNSGTLATWTVPGGVTTGLTPEAALGIPVTDFADTYLDVGNVICQSADIKVPVATINGSVTEYVEYQIPLINPSLEGSAAAMLSEPTPSQIVQSAEAFDAAYGDATILDAEDCENIARDLAAAAGAVHGGKSGNPNTESIQTANLNQPDGFWAIAYDSGNLNDPGRNWFNFLQPGDIVRIGWGDGNGGITSAHTTTVLSVAADHSSITVYDNTDVSTGQETIGIHTVLASQWENKVNPAYVTVFRLRSDGRYLVNTESANQTVYDTVYNDDVALVGPGDTIYGGASAEMIQGPSADLQGLALKNAHVGDFFQFDDAISLSSSYDSTTSVLTVNYTTTADVQGSATISLDLPVAARFVTGAATDGPGETVTIAAPTVSIASFEQDKAAYDKIGSFAIADNAANIFAGLDALEADQARITTLTSTSGLAYTNVPKFVPDETVLNKVAGGFELTGNATLFTASVLNAAQADLSHIVSIVPVNGTVTASVTTFLADEAALNKVAGGFSIVSPAAGISAYVYTLEADQTHINAITASSGTVTASVAAFMANETVLNKVGGGFAISDTAANIVGGLSALEADQAHISSITATSGTVTASVTTFLADEAALNKVATGFSIVSPAAGISAYVYTLEADQTHINAITATSGTVTASVAAFIANQTVLNKVAGTFAISDTGANITSGLTALEADQAHISSIISTSGTVTAASVAVFLADEPALNKIASGFNLAGASGGVAAYLPTLEADVSHINAVSFSDANPVLTLTQAQATSDASLLAKITGAYVENVTGSGSPTPTTTTGHGNGLTLTAVAGGHDTITGTGTSESFVFKPAFGQDIVTDFSSHLTGTNDDTITLPSSEFGSFANMMLHDAVQSGSNVILTSATTPTDQLTIDNISIATINAHSADLKFA